MDKSILFSDLVNIKAKIKLSVEEINKELDKEAGKTAKKIKIDGFRPGKVPKNVVLQRYKEELIKEAKNTLLKKGIEELIKENDKNFKDLVSEPFFEDYKEDEEEGFLEADIIISFKPKIELDDYESLIPKIEEIKISEEDIKLKEKELLKKEAKLEVVEEDRGLKVGDFALFDFEGFIDGENFEGGKAKDFTLELGSGQFIPGFEDGMLGLKVGEERDIKLSFPKNYGSADLAGKDAVFKVKISQIKALKIPKLDEEMLKKLLTNEDNISKEKLREKIIKILEDESFLRQVSQELKPKFAKNLVENIDFLLPLSVVEQETDIQFRSSWPSFSEEEVKELASDEKKYQEKRESFKDEAIKSVKLTFILDELAKQLKLSISDAELIQAIYFEAYSYGMDPKELVKNYQDQGKIGALRMSLLEDKLFAQIFKEQKEKADK